MPPAHLDEILILKEKIAALESWRLTVETDLREIRDIISQWRFLPQMPSGALRGVAFGNLYSEAQWMGRWPKAGGHPYIRCATHFQSASHMSWSRRVFRNCASYLLVKGHLRIV